MLLSIYSFNGIVYLRKRHCAFYSAFINYNYMYLN